MSDRRKQSGGPSEKKRTRRQHAAAKKANAGYRQYDVGYKRPPKQSRFKAGQSGNPRGRPKGSRNLPSFELNEDFSTMIMRLAHMPISATEDGKPVSITRKQAIVQALMANALKGNTKAQIAMLELVQAAEDQKTANYLGVLRSMLDMRDRGEAAIAEAQRLGLPPPDEILHPDYVTYDSSTGILMYDGPMEEGDLPRWEAYWEAKKKIEAEIERLARRYDRSRNRAERGRIKKLMAQKCEELTARHIEADPFVIAPPGMRFEAPQERDSR